MVRATPPTTFGSKDQKAAANRELDAALDEAFGPEPENPYRAAALAVEAELFAKNLATVHEISIDVAREMVEIVDGRVVIKQPQFEDVYEAADPERVEQRRDALVRKHRQAIAFQYVVIQRRSESATRGRSRVRVTRPRERHGRGRSRRTTTTRDDGSDGPSEPPALGLWRHPDYGLVSPALAAFLDAEGTRS